MSVKVTSIKIDGNSSAEVLAALEKDMLQAGLPPEKRQKILDEVKVKLEELEKNCPAEEKQSEPLPGNNRIESILNRLESSNMPEYLKAQLREVVMSILEQKVRRDALTLPKGYWDTEEGSKIIEAHALELFKQTDSREVLENGPQNSIHNRDIEAFKEYSDRIVKRAIQFYTAVEEGNKVRFPR